MTQAAESFSLNARIGQRLRRIISSSMTFKDAANIMGVTEKTLQRWMNGVSGADIATIHGFCDQLGIDPASILMPEQSLDLPDLTATEGQFDDISIGQRLRAICDGVAAQDVARIAKCSGNTLRRWFSGEVAADMKGAGRIASHFGTSLDWILRGDGDRLIPPPPEPEEPLAPLANTGQIEAILLSAQAFRIAIDALPVGKDIRTRLGLHLDLHETMIRALAGAAK